MNILNTLPWVLDLASGECESNIPPKKRTKWGKTLHQTTLKDCVLLCNTFSEIIFKSYRKTHAVTEIITY